jgi:sugar lactone lactonase YvrE
MKNLKSKIVVDDLIYPEGIRWHRGKVWFSDILAFKVYAYDPATNQCDMIVEIPDRPSGLGFLPDGRLLIATMGERKLLRLDPDGLKTIADLSGICTSLNDMVVDAHGRAYIDKYDMAFGGQMSGGLVMVDPAGAYRIVADKMKVPNGLAITPDGKTLVAADLMANRLVAFEIAPDGSLGHEQSFAELGADSPDGICLDAAGAVWAGFPFQGRVRRIERGGKMTHEIAYGSKWGIAPVLGGTDRRTLFICTADVTLDKLVHLMEHPKDAGNHCKGWIEAVEGMEIPGAGWP